MDDRIELSETGGQPLVYIDFSYLKRNSEFRELTKNATQVLSKSPAYSVLTLSNFEGVFYDSETKDILASYLKSNKPYVKAGAVIGLDSIKKVMFAPLKDIAGRQDIHIFKTRKEAMSWLKKQK